MPRTKETIDLVSLEDLFSRDDLAVILQQSSGFDEVAYVESIDRAQIEDFQPEIVVTSPEEVSAVSCMESIRMVAEQRFANDYEKLKRHEYRPFFVPNELFDDFDRVLASNQAVPTVRKTISDAEAEVMQSYRDAAVHTVVRKVIEGVETDIESVRTYLENTPVSDAAKVSIAKTFVEFIGTEIKATHEGATPADKQVHAHQSVIMTELANVTIGHIAITAEEQKDQPANLERDFEFLKAVSREPIRRTDYNVTPKSRFTKRATQLVMNSVVAAFSIHPGASAPAIVTSAVEAIIKASPISAGMADGLIEALSSDNHESTAKVAIAKIVSPHDSANKLTAASNLKILNEAIIEDIREVSGTEPVKAEDIPDDNRLKFYATVADIIVAERGPQLAPDQRQLLESYASLMKSVVANTDQLPEGLAAIIINQAPEGFISEVRDLALESIGEGSTAEADILMATMFANLDAILYETPAEQEKALEEMLNVGQTVEIAPTPPEQITPPETPPEPPTQPAPPAPPEVVPGPENLSLSAIKEPYRSIFKAAAEKYGIDPAFLASIFYAEQRTFNREAPAPYGTGKDWNSSPKGASGPLQFMPNTWEAFATDGNGDGKADIMDLTDAAHSAARMMKEEFNVTANTPMGSIENYWEKGTLVYAAASYNWGMGNVADKKPFEEAPEEARNYMKFIISTFEPIKQGVVVPDDIKPGVNLLKPGQGEDTPPPPPPDTTSPRTLKGEILPEKLPDGTIYFSQHDTRWGNEVYAINGNNQTVSQSGCGPTSQAMVISTLTGKNITPKVMEEWNEAHGYRTENSGTDHAAFTASAKEYGLDVKNISGDTDAIKKVLSEGGKVILNGRDRDPNSPGTRGGHIFVLRGITSQGKILIADPNNYTFSTQEWELSELMEDSYAQYAIMKPGSTSPTSSTPDPNNDDADKKEKKDAKEADKAEKKEESKPETNVEQIEDQKDTEFKEQSENKSDDSPKDDKQSDKSTDSDEDEKDYLESITGMFTD